MREFLKGLELDRETIDTIMAEYGKNVQGLREQLDEYKEENIGYKDKINELTNLNKDSSKMKEEYDALKKSIEENEQKAKAQKDDELMTNNIMKVFGNKKFTSEYAKKGLLNDIKAELKKEENQGLGVQDIFNNLVKDKPDIFANPNQMIDMEGMGDIDNSAISKADFDKMSYNQRIEFKQSNPELFEKYNK